MGPRGCSFGKFCPIPAATAAVAVAAVAAFAGAAGAVAIAVAAVDVAAVAAVAVPVEAVGVAVAVAVAIVREEKRRTQEGKKRAGKKSQSLDTSPHLQIARLCNIMSSIPPSPPTHGKQFRATF